MGFATAIFLFNLAVTGIILNHYQVFSLHQKYIQSDLLLDWYGVKAPDEINCTKLTDSKLCQLGTQIHLISNNNKSQLLLNDANPIIDLMENLSQRFLITTDGIFIYDKNFQLIDSLKVSESEASVIISAGFKDDHLLIRTEQQLLLLDDTMMELEAIPASETLNASLSTQTLFKLADQQLKRYLGQQYRKHQITQLKFIQDLHSGQILLQYGKWLTDLVGIIILLLAISGFITWQRRKNNPLD